MALVTLPHPLRFWRRGHALAWPQRQDGGTAAAIDGDTVIRVVAASAVLAVAAIAAVVSYSHIYDLARHHGESGTAARLLPVSVDGLIASASLALLHAARNRITAPWMAYLMLWLGVGATIAANVGYGLPAGWLSAVIAAWPAMAFVGSVEMALMLARNERRGPSGGGSRDRHRWRPWRVRETAMAAPDGGTQAAIGDTPARAASPPPRPPSNPPSAPPPQSVRKPPQRQREPATKTARKAATAAARVDAELAANPDRTNAEIAAAARAGERTVERRREAARKAVNVTPMRKRS